MLMLLTFMTIYSTLNLVSQKQKTYKTIALFVTLKVARAVSQAKG